MTSLASLSDLGVRLGLDLNSDQRAQAILDDVSGNVRDYTGRSFEQTTETVTVDVCCGKALLPNGPVTDVDTVQVDDVDVSFTWTSGRTVIVDVGLTSVDITYTHGWAEVPQAIIGVVCQIAGRAYGTKAQEAGAPSESLGGWAIGATPVAAAAGPLGILNDERAVLDRYRPRNTAPIRMGSWAW